MIIDCVRNESYLDYLDEILNRNCCYVQVYGSSSMDYKSIGISDFLIPSYKFWTQKIKYLLGFTTHPILSYKLKYDSTFGQAVEAVWESHKLETPIDSIYKGWKHYHRAIDRIERGHTSGKVVCIL